MKIGFEDLPVREVSDRIRDFEETFLPIDAERAQREAMRCIHCPDPAACVEACPAHNNIPAALLLIEQGDFLGAAAIYRMTSSMPEICGRVCPHEQLCQGACVRNKKGEPAMTGALEAFVADYERAAGKVEIPVGTPTGKRVAIVGSGPAGLACAEQLVQRGHAVTIFEAFPAPGGLLVYGIPNFKLAKRAVQPRIDDLRRAGVEFVNSTRIGKTHTIDQLFGEGYAAVFVGVGSGIPATMKAPGEDLPGVYQSTDFLVRTNVPQELLPAELREKPRIGRRVAVVGGGDTASDCLRTALRLGAQEVTCVYRRTDRNARRQKDRALALRAHATASSPSRYASLAPWMVNGVECLVRLGEPDAKGRRKPVPIEFQTSWRPIPSCTLFMADPGSVAAPDLGDSRWGLIEIDRATVPTPGRLRQQR
jgi:glutamate synthase (NADPH/NADH) small chain